MRIAPEMDVDALLAQATCAILSGDETPKATAWLVSDEGHLLTAGHIFVDSDLRELKVRFLNDVPLTAAKLTSTYEKNSGIDFAILKLAQPPAGRSPLPIALVKEVGGKCRVRGYGKTLVEQSAGAGEFLGSFFPQGFSDNFLFEVRGPETGEPGFSGAAIFSEELQAVVALQTEATEAALGAGRDTVLAMPMYRIGQHWEGLARLSRPARQHRPSTRPKSASPKQYLEYRIRESCQFLRGYAEDAEGQSATTLREKYSQVIKHYLQIYFLLCRRQQYTPAADILNIARDFSEVDASGTPHTLPLSTPSELYTNIPSSRIIVGVSQMFRIADLLTRPDSVKAKKFYAAITNINKMRRALTELKSFDLAGLGKLHPVITKPKKHRPLDEYGRFWNPAVPDLRLPTAQPLCFIPYELHLTEQLNGLHSQLGSVFESGLVNISETIKNSQISGRLRIYPPGIGVVTLRLALEFKREIHIELVAQLAHNIEELLFVDPYGLTKPYSDLMLDIINQVIDNLFINEGYDFAERRWQPPTTTYSFPDPLGLVPEEKINELAYLMSLAPANGEELAHLQNRIRRALRTKHWTNEQILAVAGDDVALFFVGDPSGKVKRQRRNNFLLWLAETHELICAAAYAQQAFAEEVDNIFRERILDETWRPKANGKFAYLKSLLETMRQVLRAVSAIGARGHLKDQGSGTLMSLAKDVWIYSNPVNRLALAEGLAYIADWLAAAQARKPHKELAGLSEVLRGIQAIPPLFPAQVPPVAPASTSPEREQLERRLLDQLPEIEKILFAEEGRSDRIMQKLRKQLGY